MKTLITILLYSLALITIMISLDILRGITLSLTHSPDIGLECYFFSLTMNTLFLIVLSFGIWIDYKLS